MRRIATLICLACISGLYVPLASAETPQQWVQQHLAEVVDLYRHLHRNPELSLHEVETAARMATELRNVGAEVTEKVGGTGVVAVLKNGPGSTLMLRADMDALPVVEQTGLEYASTVKTESDRGAIVGVMHACGHDIHMANLVGVARYLTENRSLWKGTLVMICQPAEELGLGSKAMLSDGLFARFPRPDHALALHVDSALETGHVAYRPGYSLANVDSIDITIHGKGGHGAYPHTTIDPVLIAARLVVDLQSIVSREIDPLEPAVITVGSIQGGTKHNVIGDDCHLQLTVRSFTDEVRKHLLESIRRKALAAAQSAAAPEPEITVSDGTPSLWNDPELTERIALVFKRVLGEQHVKLDVQSMGGEDFSRYGKAGVPIMMFYLGAVDKSRLDELTRGDREPPSLHSPLFYPDPDRTLATGIIAMASAALELLDVTDAGER